jgi:predicted nuclease of predicted toxin-antitoxin system
MSKPQEIIFFVDRALGNRVVEALREAGAQVEAHRDHFAPDALDIEWLPVVSQRGWVVLTKDKKLRHNPLELQAIAQANARVFILTAGNLRQQKTIDILVRSVQRLENIVIGNLPPFIARLHQNGRIVLWPKHSQLQRAR